MQPIGLVFFAVFAIIQFAMYMGIRRGWTGPATIAGAGVFLSMIAIGLVSLAQPGNNILQAIVVGMLLGGMFSAGTLTLAMYFQRNEQRSMAMQERPREAAEAAQ